MSTSSMEAPRRSRIRGAVAVRIVGELVMRLAGGTAWEFAAYSGEDELLLGASSGEPPHNAALQAELRLQRFAGSLLPHVSSPMASVGRRLLDVLFGAFSGRVAILRIVRPVGAKPFGPRDEAKIERFFRQHADAMCSSIFDVDHSVTERISARRAAPLAFTIDSSGNVLATTPGGDEDPLSLRAQLLPRNGKLPPVLQEVIAELLERRAQGADAGELVAVLPFALLRLTPFSASLGPPTLLATVEWLRSRASLEAAAARFGISKRELQVLNAMLAGSSVAEMADALSISESTVVFHLKRMLKKTQSKNRTELAARMLGWETAEAGQAGTSAGIAGSSRNCLA